ncbi:MAG: division/cell wall cluster transcriptional repressor MraZ [Firmicutes bacterium]|nr:division/cell wall cluster transcriptional repressor MraZ [Bacillota bacterium]
MAGVFAGTFSHSLDGKGRVIIPASFREKLGSGFTIALSSGIDALAVYPPAKWEAVNEQLSRVRDTDDEGMDYLRYIMANAQTDLEMDAQGRVLLPQPLREAVGLTRDLTFVGMRDHVEIWDAAAYAEKSLKARENFAKLRRHVNETY